MTNNSPEGWKEESLGNMVAIQGGIAAPNEDIGEGEIPFIRMKDLGNYHMTTNFIKTEGFIKRDYVEKNRIPISRKGTIIIPRSGSVNLNHRAVLGTDCVIVSHICALSPNESVNNLFLYYVLCNYDMTRIMSRTTGLNMIKFSDLEKLKFKIPKSIKEQQKIAAILQNVDNAIEKTKELIEKCKKMKQGLMHDLFTNSVDEQGVQYSQTKEHSLFGKMPDHWREGLMRDICDVSQGLQIAITERKTRPGRNRYVYITIQYLNAEDKVKSAEFVENPPKSVICSEEDVLMTRTGNTGQVITGYSGVFHNNFFIVKYDKSKVTKKYLVYYLQRPEIRNLMTSLAGLTTIPDLKHADFLNMPMIYPEDLNEQERIAQILGNIENRIQSEQNYLDKLTKIKKGLMQDLLTGKVRVAA